VRRGLTALANMEHRGAEGADADTGDGAGMLVQVPDRFFRAVCDFRCPTRALRGCCLFLPTDDRRRQTLEWLLVEKITDAGLEVLAWRDVPVVPEAAGQVAARRRRSSVSCSWPRPTGWTATPSSGPCSWPDAGPSWPPARS